ncbi:MAG: M24 family metallopeptidase, partial [Candidatus Omnitrophica bacterium]|nr:M24 family metallopeptidase [Candidatus Omnitrophota bacterium]
MENILTYEEISIMKSIGRIASDILRQLKKVIMPGETTKNIELFFNRYLEKYPGVISAFLGYNGYPASLCVSINEEIIHGIPKEDRFIKQGDIVSVDLGLKYKGLFVDCAYTYPVGRISSEAKKLIRICWQALKEGIK